MTLRKETNLADWKQLLIVLQAVREGQGEAPAAGQWLAPVVAEVKEGEVQAMTVALSTDEVDRHGDIISADGWQLDAYLENPVVLWAHDHRRPPIGRAVQVWREPHRLLARLEFAPTAFAQEVAALYRQGYQRGISVGFKPLRYQERRDEKTGAFIGVHFLEQELLEVSAVAVPANRAALLRPAGLAGPERSYPGKDLPRLLAELRKYAGLGT